MNVSLPVQMHLQCKFGVFRSITCRENIHTSIFCDDLKPSKVGQGDLFLVCNEGFISRSACARLQVYVCSGYDLCQPG